MLRQLSEASYQQVWSRWAALMPGELALSWVDRFGLTLLLLSQVDLERELEHKEALLAHCMKKEAEEVWQALVLPSDCWSHASVQYPLATYLQKSSTSSERPGSAISLSVP